MDNKKDCEHNFQALGFRVVRQKDDRIEAVASVFCTKCSLFRTKILTFIREQLNDGNNYSNWSSRVEKEFKANREK